MTPIRRHLPIVAALLAALGIACAGGAHAQTAPAQPATAPVPAASAAPAAAAVPAAPAAAAQAAPAPTVSLADAYRREFAFLEAQKRELTARIVESQRSFDADRTRLEREVATLEGRVLAARNEAEAQAQARVEKTKVDLGRTVIRAPVDGVVARRQVQLGQRVQPSIPLLSVVPVNDVYVNANFKEVQLKDVQPGQKVELTSDLYGEHVVFHGVVDGFNGGTGAAYNVSMNHMGSPIASNIRDAYLTLCKIGKQNEVPLIAGGGIGGSGDFARNAYLSVFMAPSTARALLANCRRPPAFVSLATAVSSSL